MNYFENCTSYDEVKTLFRKLAKEFHPDHGGDAEKMRVLQEQYNHFNENSFCNSWKQEKKERVYNGWQTSQGRPQYRYAAFVNPQHTSFDNPLNLEITKLKGELAEWKDRHGKLLIERHKDREEILNLRNMNRILTQQRDSVSAELNEMVEKRVEEKKNKAEEIKAIFDEHADAILNENTINILLKKVLKWIVIIILFYWVMAQITSK